MLCLLARGVHLENPAERDVNPYERFATMLNEICSGKYGFNEDIDRFAFPLFLAPFSLFLEAGVYLLDASCSMALTRKPLAHRVGG